MEATELKRNRNVLWLMAYLVLCMALTPTMASAYIDPSTTTFLVQALIGLGVAIAAGVTVYWRKARRKVNKVMGKDQTATRDESDDIDNPPGDNGV